MIRGALPIRIFRVAERSMEPTIKEGDYVVINCWYEKVEVGDIVVIIHDTKPFVKRLEKVRSREIFVVGDNRKVSKDSRHIGWLKSKSIVGKVLLII